jgi:sec-independent protein translocase protein TatB
MFDLFSWSHILILLTVALVVVGPKDLPRLMHTVGKWAGKARSMADEFKKSFDDMARQTQLDALRKEIEAMRAEKAVADINADLNKSLETASSDETASAEPEPSEATASAPEEDIGPEPRSGEFQITQNASPPVMASGEPQRS